MASIQQLLDDQGRDEFTKACNLDDKDSHNDPTNPPYKSKYKAREIWSELRLNIQNCSDNGDVMSKEIMLAVLELKLGMNYVKTEEIPSGEALLNQAAERMNPYRMNKRVCCILQVLMNQLGMIWSNRNNCPKSLAFLKESESLYKDFKHEVGSVPHMPDEIFTKPEISEENESEVIQSRRDYFENTYTLTLYYIAQVYKQTGDADTAASYLYDTLQRQLDTMKYEPYDWAINCATLSQYYVSVTNEPDFRMARHLLASASLIYGELGDAPMAPPQENESQADVDNRERIPRGKAMIARCWVNYGKGLLETSKDTLYAEVEQMQDHNTDRDDEINEDDRRDAAKKAASRDQEKTHASPGKENVYFNLEVTSYEDQITCELVKTFDQAREVFLTTQKYLNVAKEFYTSDCYCSDYVELVQDHSKLYKELAFFEMNMDRQCKMHKRRVDMLSEIVKELNPQFYLLLWRQLVYELAETYSAILDIKLAIIEEEGGQPSAHAIKKINMLTEQSIKQYVTYIDSLKNASKQLPDQFSEDDERPALVAHFCLGRLYSKLIYSDITKRLACMSRSVHYYKFLVDYGKRNPLSISKMKSEFEICEEMVTLLPLKMERMRSSSANF